MKLNLNAFSGNSFLTAITGNFNGGSKHCCLNGKTSFEGLQLDFLILKFRFSQIIKENKLIYLKIQNPA